MNTRMTCIAVLLAFGFLAAPASADESHRFTLNEAAKIGNADLYPGEYKLVVDAPRVVLTEIKTGKSLELQAKVENMDKKSDRTEIHSTRVDGVRRIIEMRFDGSRTRVAFEE